MIQDKGEHIVEIIQIARGLELQLKEMALLESQGMIVLIMIQHLVIQYVLKYI